MVQPDPLSPRSGRPGPGLGQVWRYAWAAPASAVGLACALTACCAGARARWVEGALEIAGGALPGWLARLPGTRSFAAITLGHVILGVDRPTLDASRRHEQEHVRQYERWGALFFVLYLGESAVQALCGRDPYRDNRFERAARAAAQAEG